MIKKLEPSKIKKKKGVKYLDYLQINDLEDNESSKEKYFEYKKNPSINNLIKYMNMDEEIETEKKIWKLKQDYF